MQLQIGTVHISLDIPSFLYQFQYTKFYKIETTYFIAHSWIYFSIFSKKLLLILL